MTYQQFWTGPLKNSSTSAAAVAGGGSMESAASMSICVRAAVSQGGGARWVILFGREPGPTPTIRSSSVETVTSMPCFERRERCSGMKGENGALPVMGMDAYGLWPEDPDAPFA